MYESDNSRNFSEKDRPRDFCQHIIEHFLDREGQVIGLGSGKTIAEFLSRVKDLSIMNSLRFVISSLQIRLQVEHHDLKVADETEVINIQVLLDGADQVDSGYHMIKGGGGALFREKILFKAARMLVILADREKYVNNLHRAVPVEVHPFARRLFIKEINNLEIKVKWKRILSVYLESSKLDFSLGHIMHAITRYTQTTLLKSPSLEVISNVLLSIYP